MLTVFLLISNKTRELLKWFRSQDNDFGKMIWKDLETGVTNQVSVYPISLLSVLGIILGAFGWPAARAAVTAAAAAAHHKCRNVRADHVAAVKATAEQPHLVVAIDHQ